MMCLKAMHVEVAKAAVLQYGIIQRNKGYTTVHDGRAIHGGWSPLRCLVAQYVEAVARRLQHTHSCGYHGRPIIRVTEENVFAAAVGLHPIDTM
jgi:hypothetical protein